MSNVIQQILLEKLSETSEVLLTIDIWSNSQMRSYIGVTAHSFQIKSCTMLCWLADDRNPQLENTFSNFEIINKRIISVTERRFKPDRCQLTVKDLKP